MVQKSPLLIKIWDNLSIFLSFSNTEIHIFVYLYSRIAELLLQGNVRVCVCS